MIAGVKDLQVEVFKDIRQVDPDRWNRSLAPGDLLAQHRFVKTCQESGVENAAYRHVVLTRSGEPFGVASFSRMQVRLELLSPGSTRSLVQHVRSFYPGFLQVPVLFCGLPVSFGQSTLRFRNGCEPGPILRELSGLATEVERELDTTLCCFKEFGPVEAEHLLDLDGLGFFRAHSLPFCAMNLSWASFEGYLADMRSGYRHQVRANLAHRSEPELHVHVIDDFGSLCPEIFRLYEQVMDRAPYQLERLNLSFFEGLNRNFGSASHAVLVMCEGRILACGITLSEGDTYTWLLAGIDYSENRQHHAYLNLVIEVVADAIRRGARRLMLGQTSCMVKTRMGAVLEPRYLYFRNRHAPVHHLFRMTSSLLFPAPERIDRCVFKQQN